jgi:hypothetical protein
MTFRDMDVTVTMTGEEWFTLIAKMVGKPLSKKGYQVLKSAQSKLTDQVVAASDANPEKVAS